MTDSCIGIQVLRGRRFVVNSRKSGRDVPHYPCLTRGVRRKLSGTTNADCRANPLITNCSGRSTAGAQFKPTDQARVAAQRYNGFSTGGEILRDQEAIGAAPLGLYFGICAAPQSHRVITALFREAGAAQEIAERSKKSRTAGPAVGRVFGKRVHETPMGLSQGVIR